MKIIAGTKAGRGGSSTLPPGHKREVGAAGDSRADLQDSLSGGWGGSEGHQWPFHTHMSPEVGHRKGYTWAMPKQSEPKIQWVRFLQITP